jgi:hypothetical protein
VSGIDPYASGMGRSIREAIERKYTTHVLREQLRPTGRDKDAHQAARVG